MSNINSSRHNNNNNMENEKQRINMIPTDLKQSVKSRLFRGNYIERRYESTIKCYRDIVALHKSEKELEKLLSCVKSKAQIYNSLIGKPNIFIGISDNATKQSDMLGSQLWVNLDNLAFGQYWFSIKTLQFHDNEVILKLKIVRPVDLDAEMTTQQCKLSFSESSTAGTEDNDKSSKGTFTNTSGQEPLSSGETTTTTIIKDNVNLNDFIEIFRYWGVACKTCAYEFLANDINKENIKEAIRFIILVMVSLITFTVVGIKHVGIFILHFMCEFNRLVKALTPIVLKIVDFISKIVGGFFILIAMLFGNKNAPPYPRYQPLQYKQRY